MRISDWSSDVCSSDLEVDADIEGRAGFALASAHCAIAETRIILTAGVVSQRVGADLVCRVPVQTDIGHMFGRLVERLAVERASVECGFTAAAAHGIGEGVVCREQIGRASCRERGWTCV